MVAHRVLVAVIPCPALLASPYLVVMVRRTVSVDESMVHAGFEPPSTAAVVSMSVGTELEASFVARIKTVCVVIATRTSAAQGGFEIVVARERKEASDVVLAYEAEAVGKLSALKDAMTLEAATMSEAVMEDEVAEILVIATRSAIEI